MLEDIKYYVGCLGYIILIVLGTVGALVLFFVAPGVAGWFIADRFWKQGELGASIAYAVTFTGFLIYSLSDLRIRALFIRAILALIVSLPLVYVLVLIMQLVLLLSHSVQYISFQNYFLTCIPGVLLGCGLGMLWALKGTFKIASEKSDKELRELNWNAYFFDGFAIRFPLAFLIASLINIPEALLARIIVGTFLGVGFTTTLVVTSTLINKEPLEEDFSFYIFLAEVVLILLMLIWVVYGLLDRKDITLPLEVFLSACAACFVTYLLALLFTFIVRHIRGLKREKAQDVI